MSIAPVVLDILNKINTRKQNSSPIELHTALFDSGLLDSFEILQLIEQLEMHFGIKVIAADMTHDNFNSAARITALIEKYHLQQTH
jgi:acyl carrier protein